MCEVFPAHVNNNNNNNNVRFDISRVDFALFNLRLVNDDNSK